LIIGNKLDTIKKDSLESNIEELGKNEFHISAHNPKTFQEGRAKATLHAFFDKAIHRQYYKNQHHMYRNSPQAIGISPFKPNPPPSLWSAI